MEYGIIGWIIVGLIAGILAKWMMPGGDPGGIIVTILIGIAGGLLGGFVASQGNRWRQYRQHRYRNRGRDSVAGHLSACVSSPGHLM